MALADERLKELENLPPSAEERTAPRCRAAADLIQKGQYEAARDALGKLWPGLGRRPEVGRLPPLLRAELLLRCGTLTGWLGSLRNVSGAQEQAKDMLSEAQREFQSGGAPSRASEAQYELAMCYWRLGAFDDARVLLLEALRPLREEDVELKARILIRRTLVEVSENRYYEALAILKEAEPVFESAGDDLKGRWHGQTALVLDKLATAEGRAELFDRAIIEYTAAIFHYEQAGHERYCATNLNNLAMLLYRVGRYAEAHEHLDRARAFFERLGDFENLAHVDDTRARALVAERRYAEAKRAVGRAVSGFEQGGASALLADALTVQGVVLSRLGLFDDSVSTLRRAMAAAQDSGALTQAGLAALTLIEEHGAARRLTGAELASVYRRADEFLKETQDAEDVARLRACSRIVIERLSGAEPGDESLDFYGAVHELEARLIERALELEAGSVSRAARLLGLKHQSLSYMLQARHKHLLGKRTPPEKRRRSIIRKPS